MPDDISYARARAVLSLVDLGEWEVLIDPIAEELAMIYASGMAGAAGLAEYDIDLDQANEQAAEWARERAAELVQGIEENTREMLADETATAIESGASVDELAEEIASSTGFSADRAAMIARTETIRSLNQGELRIYKDSGVVEMVEWMTAGDDLVSEDCQENEDEGPIALGEDFPSGDDAPPAHPNCRCALAPVFAPAEEAEEEG